MLSALQNNHLRLLTERQRLNGFSIATALANDTARTRTFSVEAAGLHLDFSRNLLDNQSLQVLLQTAEEAGLQTAISDLFSGKPLNTTEARPALHTLLRADTAPSSLQPWFDEVTGVLDKISRLVDAVHQGIHRGASGQRFTDVVNIGIGGSDLGPAMAYLALSEYSCSDLRCHFISNVDPQQIEALLRRLNPETTFFIIASKSFGTQETLANMRKAREWLTTHMADHDRHEVSRAHFVAVTANPERAQGHGLDADLILPMWDWVGGRYSLWSSIGLSLALAIGMDNFRHLLAGARDMDEHFRTSPLERNMPVILALLSIWYTDFWESQSLAVIPYSQALNRFPAYLQQLSMESNGKSVRLNGESVDYNTNPVVWGEAGTNSQHSFFQLLHQGTHLIPVDFILPLTSPWDRAQHSLLVANCIAQSRALMLGTPDITGRGANPQEQWLNRHKAMPGNRPSNTISFERLCPRSLGALIALYEHKTFAESVLWDINAFDQWGVELGKKICEEIHPQLTDARTQYFDASTEQILERYRACQTPSSHI